MRTPKRIFAFGCSFTNYLWAGWSEVLAYELNAPLYNFGVGGACNQFIFNSLIQAHAHYKFNADDLVIVEWTSMARRTVFEDGEWHLTSPKSEKLAADYDSLGFFLRDIACIAAAQSLLNEAGCEWYNFKMTDFFLPSLAGPAAKLEANQEKVEVLFGDTLNAIKPSFFDVLYGGKVGMLVKRNADEFQQPHYAEAHPFTTEHLKYLEAVLPIKFSPQTVDAVNAYTDMVKQKIHEYMRLVAKDPALKTGFSSLLFCKYGLFRPFTSADFPKNVQKLPHDKLFVTTTVATFYRR